MNKIYKVIWSKVKHQYVVVSELAHSNGKQSRTARKSLRSRIAALVVSGAVAAFGVFGVLPMQQALAESIPMGTGMTQESNNNDVTIVIEGEMKSEEDGSFVFSEDLMDKPWGVMELAGEHINFSSDGGTAGNDKRIVISAMEKIGYAKDENGNVIFENGEGKLAYWDLKDNTLKYCGTNEIVNDEDEQGFAPQIKPEYMSKYLDVGSVVRGNIDKPKDVKADKGNLTSLSINGDYYNVTDYALQDGQVAVGETETIYDKDGKSNPVEVQTGATFLKVADRNDPTKSDDVKVDGLVTYNTREDNKGNVTTDYGNITLAGYVEKDENGNIKYDEKGHPIRQGTLITNVKDGTIWKDSKDAVNGSQLYAVDQKVNAGWTAKVGETSINVRPNLENETGKDVLNFEAGDNIKLTPNADENKIKIAADGVVSYDKNTSGGYDTTSVTLGEEGNKYVPVSDDGKTPASGGVKLTNVAYASGNDKSEAVNVDYLEKYVDKNGGGSWNITANKNDENATSIGKGNTVDFSGDDNITVAKTDKADKSGADITVNLNDNITLGEGENQIQLNGAPKDDDTPAISVGNNFAVNHDGSITSTVANNAGGGAKADATFNFDEHGLSVKDNVGKTSTLIDGGTITVRNALDNQTVINGKAITAGDIKLNSENNASTMVGLSNTTWENNETWQNEHVVDNRAATEGQLKQAINNLETSTTGNEKHIATAADGEAHPQGGYTVDKEDHTVTLTEVDGNGKATGNNVVISGIASSDEVGDLNYSKVVNEGDDLTINDDDSVTLAIGKLDDRVINNTNNITKLQGQTIDGGYVEDGVINLTHKNDDNTTKTVAQIDGLKDYTLQNGQFITKAKDENGKFTGATELTIADRYDPTKTEKVTIDGLVTYNTTQKLDETTGETIVTGIDYDNIRLAGENGTRITNLVDGWVDKKSTDAVNGSQLASVKDGAVKYWQNEDGSYDKSFVQLEGGEDGTLVTHVRDGAVNEYSSDAVNGSQLWETQQQIEEVQTEAGKHTTVTVNGGMTAPEDGSYTHDENGKLDGNLLLKQTNNDGQIEYDLKLNPDLTLQGEDGSTARVEIGGTNGTIMATKDPNSMAATTTIDGGNIYAGSSITVGTPNENEIVITNKDITGLSNTNWDGTTDNVSRAATEGQLQTVSKDVASLNDGAVKYWKNEDGSYDKSFVQLEGGEDGTLVTHVRDGAVNEYSSDAVNGSQLWETQQQIEEVQTEAGKHTTVTVNGGMTAPEDGSYTHDENGKLDGNLLLKQTNNDGQIEYDLKLNPDLTLQGEDGSTARVEIGGTNGTIMATKDPNSMAATTTIDGGNIYAGSSITVGTPNENEIVITNKDITGLSNTNWDGTTDNVSRAATEGQLQTVSKDVASLNDGTVKYWKNEDGSYDKSFVQLEGGEEGTTITHLKDGVVAEYSTEAINGSQLWETQQQIKDVETTANKHTIVSTTDDSNLTVKNVAKEGEADNYQVTLNDEVVLGDYFDKGNGVLISGNSGTISATNSITVGEDQGLVIDGQKKTIQGLSNTTWTGTTETPNRAATEGQLQNAYDGSVKYWRNEDGTYDKSFIQLEGGEEGTTITHLKDGVVAEYSTEAINGSQLWETQQQIKDVETTANKHTIVSTTKDSNLTVKNVAGEGEADNYQVALKDDITLKGDSSSIELTGTKGTIQVNQETAEGTNFTNINGNVVSIGYTNSEGIENAIVIDGGKGTITGLSNTTWDDELATQVANSEELQGTAATQGQLQQAVSAVATEAAKQHTTVSGDDNLTVKSSVNENGGTNYQVTLDDDITLGNPKAGNTEGERSFTINTTDPEGYVPKSYETGSGADFIKENGGFMLFATDTQGYGVFGVTAKGSAWAKDFKTYTTDIYGNNTQYSLNEIGDAVAQMSSYYNKENGKSYTVFSRYLNEAEKDNPFATVDENATRDIPLALRDDGTVLIGATIKGDDFIDNGIRINAEIDDDGNNVATITGLENTTWTPPAPVATFANEGTETSRAATEAQLNDLYSTVVGYNVDTNGVNYGTVTLGGGRTSYDQDTHEGGTVLNNVAYASGTDGSEAVNVDYLKDTINKAVEAGGSISNSDKHLVANTAEGSNGVYKPNAEGNVNLIVSDEKGNSSTVTIGDVASKTELDSLKTNVGDLNYDKVTGDKLVNGDSVTTAIGKLDNKIENISGTATDAANNTVTGGTIKDDGTISLTQKDGGTVALDGKLTDSGVVQDGTKFDGETGTITITSQDKYSGKTSSVKVEGIASTEVVGATNKEDLATAYKDADKDGNATTEYITDSESMVEADVALDHAIQDVANTGYANDMVLSNRIDSVEKRLGNVEERIDKVGAMAAAIANLRTMGFDPEAPTEIAIGVGQYKSETGIAIGVFHYPNQDFMLSASLSSSGDELMGGIGATWKLGRKSAAERAKDEEARHLEQAEEMKKLAQQEKVKAQAQRHAKLLAERQQASQKNA